MPILALVTTGLALLAGCAEESAPTARPIARDPNLLVVYCACALRPAVEAARDRYLSANAGKSVELTADEPLELQRRVKDGEVPDIFVCPGEAEIGELEREGYLDRGSRQSMGGLGLALIVPRGNPARVRGPQDLRGERVKSIAVPTPGMTSPGAAAKNELERAGLWDKLQDRITVKQTALEVLEAVRAGQVDAAVVYEPCLRLNMSERPESISGEPAEAAEVPAEVAETSAPSVEIVSLLTAGGTALTRICAAAHKRSPNALPAQRFMRTLAATIEGGTVAEPAEPAAEGALEGEGRGSDLLPGPSADLAPGEQAAG